MATGPVSRPSSILITMTPVSASPAMMARWIGAAPRQRGSSEACRLKQPSGKLVEDRFRQDQAVSHDNGGIGAVGAHRFRRVGISQRLRRERSAIRSRSASRATGLGVGVQSAAAGRLRRAGIDRRDLMAAADKFDQRRHGEFRRAHEDEAERQSRLHLLRCLGEFLGDAVALELGQVIDEQHAVGVVDLVLQAGREQARRPRSPAPCRRGRDI